MTTIEYSSSSTIRVYVALADILPLELRPQASCAGLCYLVVEQHIQAGSYRVKAAALPQRLSDPRCHRVFTVFVEADELAQVLPYDRALQSIPTCDLRELLEQRGSGGRDLLCAPGEEQRNGSAPSLVALEPSREERAALLPELFVSQQTVADAARRRIKIHIEQGIAVLHQVRLGVVDDEHQLAWHVLWLGDAETRDVVVRLGSAFAGAIGVDLARQVAGQLGLRRVLADGRCEYVARGTFTPTVQGGYPIGIRLGWIGGLGQQALSDGGSNLRFRSVIDLTINVVAGHG